MIARVRANNHAAGAAGKERQLSRLEGDAERAECVWLQRDDGAIKLLDLREK